MALEYGLPGIICASSCPPAVANTKPASKRIFQPLSNFIEISPTHNCDCSQVIERNSPRLDQMLGTCWWTTRRPDHGIIGLTQSISRTRTIGIPDTTGFIGKTRTESSGKGCFSRYRRQILPSMRLLFC
jgi:hypothetical protein